MAIAVQQVARTVPTGWTFAFPIRRLVRLFHRVGRGIELTETGRLFLVEARSVLARSAAAELALAELGGLRRGTLLVQASQTISSYWLPRHLVAFRRAHPGVEVRLQVGNTAQVAAAVHEGAAELGFVEGAVRDPMLTSTTVARDQLVVVVAPGHPWAECRTIECAKLPDSAWVLREPGSGTRSAFEAALEGFGISPGILRVALELPTNEAVRAAVEAGAGATAISASVVAGSIEAGLLHRVVFNLPDRDFHVLRHAERYRNRAGDALMAVIAEATLGPRAGSPHRTDPFKVSDRS